MIENNKVFKAIAYILIVIGVLAVMFPVYITFVASTQTAQEIIQAPMSLKIGDHFWDNYSTVIRGDVKELGVKVSVVRMMTVSFISAIGITMGKIFISILSAFALVYFRFRFRNTIFALIFITLMLPVEVRITPTYKIIADFGLLNSYSGLIFPLIASATATFLFRQFFMTVPDELVEAAKVDGVGPLRFLKDILLPLSLTSIAALFVIQFIYGWNQYLWPLLVSTREEMYPVVVGIKQMIANEGAPVPWHLVMATSMLALLPPTIVIISMQKWFVKGLVDSEK